jgi:hypothetical protein
MTGVETKGSASPEEKRPFVDTGEGLVVTPGGHTVIKGTFEPGSHWKEHPAPIAGSESCQSPFCSTSCPGTCRRGWTTGPTMGAVLTRW